MNTGRLGFVLVVVCFCAPLFVGLGRGDLWGDEAGHSFSVDRILETGDWLVPKSSPSETAEFLEKPPLKFWIVALPIRIGLLPHDEFGLRFWDALFGGIAFLYVYAIGRRLAGEVCGLGAVLTLFAFWPLVFDHGLRSNNMEASLLLCYCGGVHHFLRAGADTGGWRDKVAVALYFTLGFMTKFAAALFLPFILVVAVAFVPRYRRECASAWKAWAGAGALAVVLIAPWFVFASVRFGRELWDVMFGQQLLTRMASALDPGHVQPWSFYWVTLYRTYSYGGALPAVAAGLLVLAVQACRRRSPDMMVVLVWALVPLFLISFGRSKLIHYMYPFVPPFALGAGYLVALIVMLAPVALERARRRPVLPAAVVAVGVMLGVLAVTTAAWGPLSLELGGRVVFRNASIFRPAIVAAVALCIALGTRRSVRFAAVLLAIAVLPVPAYAEGIATLDDGQSPLRDMRDCLEQVQARSGATPGIYIDIPEGQFQHHTYYYFRRRRPFIRADTTDIPALQKNVEDGRPLLISEELYEGARRGGMAADRPFSLAPAFLVSPERVYGRYLLIDDVLRSRVVLPGPYAACRPLDSHAR